MRRRSCQLRMSILSFPTIHTAHKSSRVFNHYNRVRANISALESQEAEMHWEENSPEDRASVVSGYFRPSHTRNAVQLGGVASAQIHPHPYRIPLASVPLHAHQNFPLFEKSNVLVMYAILWNLHLFIPTS